jgi:Flp pilus assembly protein TadD
MRISHGLLPLGLVFLGGAVAAAQQPPAVTGTVTVAPAPTPPPMTNLQIFPKDTPRQQVIQTMQAFAQALGVRCEHCHVDEGPGKQDFASDQKLPKKTARAMMQLTRDVNAKIPDAVGKTADAATRVQCVTCHRGVAVPKQLSDIMTDAITADGAAAAIAKYRDLRKVSFGGQSYDFSEGGLLVVAQRLTAANKADDALAVLQVNAEFYPQSARTYLAMAQAYQRNRDTAGAVRSLEKAVELDPQNAQARRMLDALKK